MTNSMASRPIYRQLGLPVFQNKVYATAESAKQAVSGDVELVQCPSTGLVYNALFESVLLDYDQDYQNEQACSNAFRQHLERVRQIILAHVDPLALIVEIGCGKGYFLEMLADSGANIRGYDPAYEGGNPKVIKKYFGSTDVPAGDRPDLLVLRHVLEHIPSPLTFLADLLPKCAADAKIYIEVPCFDWIVKNDAFYDVFYEHVNYFTLEVLENSFSKVLESGRLFGGQYLYVIAELASFKHPSRFSGKIFSPLRLNEYLDDLVARRHSSSIRQYVWGAGAKGITFSNILLRKGIPTSGLIDINPAKQGKFAGLSGIPIFSPENVADRLEGADVFVMNPVYLDEIRRSVRAGSIHWIPVAS